jgi:hypothetical protein
MRAVMRAYALKLATIAVGLSMIAGGGARAVPIEYIFSGTADGTLGGTGFSGSAFQIDLFSDTSTVTSGGGEFSNIATVAKFTLGTSTGTLGGSFNNVVLNPGFLSGTVIFGQGQSVDPFFVGEGLSAAALGAYDLASAFALTSGPVSQTINSIYFTSLGDLSFGNISSLSFQADVSSTPLPASWTMMLAVLAGFGLMLSRRTRQETVHGMAAA